MPQNDTKEGTPDDNPQSLTLTKYITIFLATDASSNNLYYKIYNDSTPPTTPLSFTDYQPIITTKNKRMPFLTQKKNIIEDSTKTSFTNALSAALTTLDLKLPPDLKSGVFKGGRKNTTAKKYN